MYSANIALEKSWNLVFFCAENSCINSTEMSVQSYNNERIHFVVTDCCSLIMIPDFIVC